MAHIFGFCYQKRRSKQARKRGAFRLYPVAFAPVEIFHLWREVDGRVAVLQEEAIEPGLVEDHLPPEMKRVIAGPVVG